MKAILFIIWMFLTAGLALSLVGLLLFVPKDAWENQEATPSTWMTIGKTLLKEL